MANINYKRSMKKILSDSTDMTITRNGIELMNELLNYINSRLVNLCLEKAQNGMDVQTARSAVEELFPKSLSRFAFMEGNRVLTLYTNGLIDYKPPDPDLVKRKKKSKKAMAVEALEFADGISNLTSLAFPETSLQDQAKTFLCELLEELALKISSFVQSKGKSSITAENIRAALSRSLPPELLRHALAEGDRMAILYATGMLEETIRKEAYRKRKRSTSVRKSVSPSPKRKRMPSTRKVSKKKTIPKTSQRRSKPKVSRKRAPSRKMVTPKKHVSRKSASRIATRPKVSRKKSVPRKRPIRVPPKTVRRISEKKPMKEKMVSEKVTSREITTTTAKEINRGARELNEMYEQTVPTESFRIVADFIREVLDRLIAEMDKLESRVIGPVEVREAVMKVFPPSLYEVAIAQLSRVLMT